MRVCLDLNVWCAAFLADRAGYRNTSTQRLVLAARTGQSPLGPFRLVISLGMLNRLEQVLVTQLKADRMTAKALVQAIGSYAKLGPQLTLGGTGIVAIHDAEDQHVLETALAGKAEILVTRDMRGFRTPSTKILKTGSDASVGELLMHYHSANGTLLIAQPFEIRDWFNVGRMVLPEENQPLGW